MKINNDNPQHGHKDLRVQNSERKVARAKTTNRNRGFISSITEPQK